MEKIFHEILPWEKKYGFISLKQFTPNQLNSFFPNKEQKYYEIVAFGKRVKARLELMYNRLYITKEAVKDLREGDKINIILSDSNEIILDLYQKLELKEEKIEEYKDLEYDKKKYVEVLEENRELQKKNNSMGEQNREFEERLEKFQSFHNLFNSEAELEGWVIKNIYKILPGITLIDNQIHMKWGDGKFNRSDLFGITPDGKLVILENKTRKRDLRSAESQYLSYKSWVRRNENKLLDEYREKGLKEVKNTKFIIITDHYTDRLQAICEDNKICLIHIEGGFNIQQITPFED